MLILESTEKFRREGEAAPNIHPMPQAQASAPREAQPRVVWQRWASLPKEALLVRVECPAGLPAEEVHLDAVLSVAAMAAQSPKWFFRDREAGVIPLPLELLGIVPVPSPSRKPPRLPVWASTPFAVVGRGLEAQCVGHADEVLRLLRLLTTIGGVPVQNWQVIPTQVPVPDAVATIRHLRPLPSTAEAFTPPYWYDWEVGAAR